MPAQPIPLKTSVFATVLDADANMIRTVRGIVVARTFEETPHYDVRDERGRTFTGLTEKALRPFGTPTLVSTNA